MPKSEIVKYIKISDAAIINLKRSNTFKNVIPSKIFENVALKVPILLGLEGESKDLIKKAELVYVINLKTFNLFY